MEKLLIVIVYRPVALEVWRRQNGLALWKKVAIVEIDLLGRTCP